MWQVMFQVRKFTDEFQVQKYDGEKTECLFSEIWHYFDLRLNGYKTVCLPVKTP